MVGKSYVYNSGDDQRIAERLYKCSVDKYPSLSEDLYITCAHSLLVDELSQEQLTKIKNKFDKVYVTEGKYRLMAILDDRAEPYGIQGTFPVYHVALENDLDYTNYGIYANGLLVESCSKRFLSEKSNMELLL